jgi:hypothetical protein
MKSFLKVLRVAFVFILINISFALVAKAQYYIRLDRDPDTEHLYDDHSYHEAYDFYIRCYTNSSCTVTIPFPSDVLVSITSSYTIQSSNPAGNYSSGPSTGYYGAGMGDDNIDMHSFATYWVDNDYWYTTFNFSIAATAVASGDPLVTYTIVP